MTTIRKLVQSYDEHLKPARLYMDDLEKIVDILRDLSSQIEISAEGYGIDNVRQLPDLKVDCLHSLQIRSREPYLSLEFKPSSIWLYIDRDDAASRGTFEKIKRVVSERRRGMTWLVQNSILVGLFTGASVPLMIWSKSSSGINWAMFALGVVVMILGALWIWYGFHDRFKRYAIIVPKYRVDSPSFFRRNADNILLAFVSAVLGALATFVISKAI